MALLATRRYLSDCAPVERDGAGPALEALEARVLLAFDPATFPDLSDLIDADNTVIRIETDLGAIDLELFDQAGPDGASAAPATVANFLGYITRGDLDLTFFHRLDDISSNGIPDVLQGGGFRFEDGVGFSAVTTQPPVANEFDAGRSNVERTIAMAKLAGDPDSATSQFFFNLEDNAAILDDPANNGGFTVFGRVVNDASWDVVMMIAALSTENFQDLSNPLTIPLTDVPVTATGSVPSEMALVDIVDIEVIKPAGVDDFFTRVLYMPEGFSDGSIIETLHLLNTDASVGPEIHYQVVVRYETGQRDAVIASGTLATETHLSIRVTDFNAIDDALVRFREPYAYEVQTTGIVAATLIRTDSGKTGGENFLAVGELSTLEKRRWTFPHAEKGPGATDAYVVWQNISGEPANVTAVFEPQSVDPGNVITITHVVDAYRRGGLNINLFESLADGPYTVRVVSDQPVVAMISQYEVDGSGQVTGALLTSGTPLDGTRRGVLPAASIPAVGEAFLTVFNNSDVTGIVQFEFLRSDGGGNAADNVTVPPGTFETYDLRQLLTAADPFPADTFFTILYELNIPVLNPPVAVQYTSIVDGDVVATRFATHAALVTTFAAGAYDPDNATALFQETYSVYNPSPDTSVSVRFSFLFSDGTKVIPMNVRVDPGETVHVHLDGPEISDTFRQQVIDAMSAGNTFGVQIALFPGSLVVVQQTRRDEVRDETFTTLGLLSLGAVPLTDAQFEPGGIMG